MSYLGNVYLIHFDAPFKGCRHYIGFTNYLEKRVQYHKAGTGSRLLRAVSAAGINYEVVRVFKKVDRNFERYIKSWKESAAFCPLCRPHTFRTPKGYIDPPAPQKRPYKVKETTNGIEIYSVVVAVADLFRKLRTRFRVGQTFSVNGKKYIRQNARSCKRYFSEYYEQAEISELPGVEIYDESVLMTREKWQFLLNRIPPDWYKKEFLGTWEPGDNLREILPSERELSKPKLRPFNEPGSDYYDDPRI